jgi:hypothetical protein
LGKINWIELGALPTKLRGSCISIVTNEAALLLSNEVVKFVLIRESDGIVEFFTAVDDGEVIELETAPPDWSIPEGDVGLGYNSNRHKR